MASLISTYGIEVIILILLMAIPALVNFITWCKKLWTSREQFKQDNINKGRAIEKSAEAEEERLLNGEARMAALEKQIGKLTEIIEKQQQQIELLIKSDELDIKSWIKAQHEKWIPRKCIDSQTLDLLAQRYAIYEQEGGNSWAKKLVEELRALPTVTVVAVNEIHELN